MKERAVTLCMLIGCFIFWLAACSGPPPGMKEPRTPPDLEGTIVKIQPLSASTGVLFIDPQNGQPVVQATTTDSTSVRNVKASYPGTYWNIKHQQHARIWYKQDAQSQQQRIIDIIYVDP